MKQGISLGFSQSLSLTPQLQQSIRLLQLSSLELEQEIEQQLLTNPFLERDDESSERERFDSFEGASAVATQDTAPQETTEAESEDFQSIEEANWDGDGTTELSPNDTEWGMEAGSSQSADGDFDPFGGLSANLDLTDHLKRQAQHLRLSPEDCASLEFLIESLDERGFLVESLEDLATSLTSDEEDIERITDQLRIAKQWLINLEPCGIGASDISECLRLQLLAQPRRDAIALKLVALPLAQLASRNIQRMALACDCTEAQVQKALQNIRSLEPVPARRFIVNSNSVVIPDVFVRALAKQKFDVQLNTDLMPRLKIDEITARLLKIHKARETKNEAMQQSLLEARGFIKAITQRFDTILRVAKAIVARQGQFLTHGAVAMRPLVLRDIAEELGLHESTVSRVTTSKYMHTPQGTFEFKYFFDASLGTDSGGETSGTAVRALISQLIGAENKARPLSDGKLADLLQAQGIECARRTVAKYREAMRIPVASLRRT